MALSDRLEAQAKKFENENYHEEATALRQAAALAKYVVDTVPYVLATLSDGNVFPAERGKDWREVHNGRRMSSNRQLEALLTKAQ